MNARTMVASPRTRRARLYGVAILAGTPLSVFAMAHHPAPHGATTTERLNEIAQLANR